MYENKNIDELLQELTHLRNYGGDEKSFWENFLKNVTYISKSYYSFTLSKKDDISLELEYNPNNIEENLKEDIFQQSLSCINGIDKKEYNFEKLMHKQISNHFIVSINLNDSYYLVLLIENTNKIEFSNSIIRALLCRDIPLSFNSKKTNIKSDNIQLEQQIHNQYFEIVLVILNTILNEKKFQLASMKIVETLAHHFKATKVSLGWEEDGFVKTIAINQIEGFEKSGPAIKSLEAIYEESYEQNEEIYFPFDEESTLITYANKLYCNENNLQSVYSFPLRIENKPLGIVTFEMKEGFLSEIELETIRLSLNYIAVFLNNIYENDIGVFKKSKKLLRDYASGFFGPKDSLKKLFLVGVSFLLLWVVFGKIQYKVEAVASIETDNIYYLSAPFDGIVQDVNITSGEKVDENQTLATFDTQELSLKKLEILSDIVRYTTETEKARASRALADMKISQAKKEQSLVSLNKVDYYLSKAVLKAPFEGIVVKGDKETLFGSPFSKGDVIIQIANPTDLYCKLKIEEQYIDEIEVGKKASLNLLSKPDVFFDVQIDKIIPMANVDDLNGNVYIVKVVFLDEIEDWIRPGMSGVAKIEVEDRSILWILTHKLSDYFYMNIWW